MVVDVPFHFYCHTVTPKMEFTASTKQVYTGDPVEFICTVRMAFPEFPSVKLLSGKPLPSHNIDEVLTDDYTYSTEVWLYEQKELKEDYVCRIDYYIEDDVLNLEKNITIYSYSKHHLCFSQLFFLDFPL